MTKKRKDTVKFIHQFPDNYRILPVNGAWGGITSRGDLVMHLFVEHTKVPQEEIQIVKEDGSFVPVRKESEEIEVLRVMQTGVMMNREQAVSMARWMLDKVEKFEHVIKVEKKKLKKK